jgi:hypothetical protein
MGQFADAVPNLEKAAPQIISVTFTINCPWHIESWAKSNLPKRRWRAHKNCAAALSNATKP